MLRQLWNIGFLVLLLTFNNVVLAQAVENIETSTLQVNVNTAAVDELMKLPGIGKSKAQAIVDSREREGLFFNIQELARVKGIGTGLIDKIEAHVVLE
ncbi:helix-hairpin-helix domain-containing protein [Pseudoalteromonas luteoviolacea]|uniref:ComEA family DNA-binding protein n=1 Tax=Pseudoalteromonas luteoviolacea TaxID=43657 RepID=UPI001F363D83|nr:helix-hairpin-helix domain-containing protein [Pseudoalteromonas luteoviolacea]MCF6438301.1 helix-hairpin-helix domain-containing protein [Pseudoalteromonas luteoviolacea]